MKLVRICMDKNYFTFRSEDYKQLKGARMGNSLLKSISDRFQIEGHLGEFLSRRVQKNLWFRPNAYQFPHWMGRNLYRLRIKNVFPTARIGVTHHCRFSLLWTSLTGPRKGLQSPENFITMWYMVAKLLFPATFASPINTMIEVLFTRCILLCTFQFFYNNGVSPRHAHPRSKLSSRLSAPYIHWTAAVSQKEIFSTAKREPDNRVSPCWIRGVVFSCEQTQYWLDIESNQLSSESSFLWYHRQLLHYTNLVSSS